MSLLQLLVPAAIFLGAIFLGGFLWAAWRGQFEDLETPAHRMLFDDDDQIQQKKGKSQ